LSDDFLLYQFTLFVSLISFSATKEGV